LAAKADDLEAIRSAVVDAAGVSAGLWLSYLFMLRYSVTETRRRPGQSMPSGSPPARSLPRVVTCRP
jgi:hypothetical protein